MIGGRFPRELHEDGFNNQEGGYEGPSEFEWRSNDGESFNRKIVKTITNLVDDGHQIILIYPIPEVGINVPKYIFNAVKGKNISEIRSVFTPLTTSFAVYKERSKSTFDLFDSIKSTNIHRVYPHILFCDNQVKERCVTHNDEDVFYADDDHLSAKGADMIVDLIMEQIVKAEANIRQNSKK